MPPKYVKTIQEELFHEYAKLISRSVFKGKVNYGFVSARFKALRDGETAIFKIYISGRISTKIHSCEILS